MQKVIKKQELTNKNQNHKICENLLFLGPMQIETRIGHEVQSLKWKGNAKFKRDHKKLCSLRGKQKHSVSDGNKRALGPMLLNYFSEVD